MIKLKSIHIENLFQYHHFDIAFSPGINIILGPNGSGKTNLLHCINYGLTGELPRKKADCVNKDTGKTEYFVELHCEIGTNDIVIRRGSHIQEININGEDTIIGNAAVNNFLKASLGIEPEILKKLIFLSGNDLREIVECTAKERLEFLQTFLPLKNLQKLWTDIGQWLSIKTAEYARDYAEECNKYYQLEEKIKLYGPVRSVQEILDDIRFVNEIEKVKAQYESQLEQYRNLDETFRELENKLNTLKGLQFQENPIYEQFLTKLDIIKSLNKKVAEALQEWRNRPAPIRSIPQEEINAAKVKVEILKQQSQRLQEFLALLENENRCPICKSPVNTKELVANYKNELQETISDIRLQEVKVRDMERQNQRALTTAKTREQVRMKLNKLRSERDTYLGLKMREINLQEILEYQKKKEQNQKLEIQIANLQQELAYVTGLRESSKKMINQLKNTLDDMLLKCACQKGMQALEAELKVAKEVEDAKIQLDLLKGYVHKQQDIERKRKKLQVIQHVRAVFHSEAVPKILTRRFLNALNSVINNYLDILHVNYSATFQEDGSCLITYKTGKRINEKQISFGEQLMLALSLYLSLNTLKRSLKLLILDEPTIGLDDDHVERVPSLLLNLLREPSLQIICATHEKKLLRAAYQVVELGGTNAAYT